MEEEPTPPKASNQETSVQELQLSALEASTTNDAEKKSDSVSNEGSSQSSQSSTVAAMVSCSLESEKPGSQDKDDQGQLSVEEERRDEIAANIKANQAANIVMDRSVPKICANNFRVTLNDVVEEKRKQAEVTRKMTKQFVSFSHKKSSFNDPVPSTSSGHGMYHRTTSDQSYDLRNKLALKRPLPPAMQGYQGRQSSAVNVTTSDGRQVTVKKMSFGLPNLTVKQTVEQEEIGKAARQRKFATINEVTKDYDQIPDQRPEARTNNPAFGTVRYRYHYAMFMAIGHRQ